MTPSHPPRLPQSAWIRERPPMIIDPYRECITHDLLVRYLANQAGGDTALDSSGNGHHGTLVPVSANYPKWVSSPFPDGGYCLRFEGVYHYYVSFPSDIHLKGARSASWCFWVQPEGSAPSINQVFAWALTSATSIARIGILRNSANKFQLVVRDAPADPSGTAKIIAAPDAMSSGTRYHVCGTFDSVADSMVLYINGASVGSLSGSFAALGTSTPSQPTTLNRVAEGSPLNAYMSDIRLYASTVDGRAALTAAEVDAIYRGRG